MTEKNINKELSQVIEEVSKKVNLLNANFNMEDVKRMDGMVREKINSYFEEIGYITRQYIDEVGKIHIDAVRSLEKTNNKSKKTSEKLEALFIQSEKIISRFSTLKIDDLEKSFNEKLEKSTQNLLSIEEFHNSVTKSRNQIEELKLSQKDINKGNGELLKSLTTHKSGELKIIGEQINSIQEKQEQLFEAVNKIKAKPVKIIKDPIWNEIINSIQNLSKEVNDITKTLKTKSEQKRPLIKPVLNKSDKSNGSARQVVTKKVVKQASID